MTRTIKHFQGKSYKTHEILDRICVSVIKFYNRKYHHDLCLSMEYGCIRLSSETYSMKFYLTLHLETNPGILLRDQYEDFLALVPMDKPVAGIPVIAKFIYESLIDVYPDAPASFSNYAVDQE